MGNAFFPEKKRFCFLGQLYVIAVIMVSDWQKLFACKYFFRRIALLWGTGCYSASAWHSSLPGYLI